MIPFLFVLLPSYLAEFQNSNSHWAWIFLTLSGELDLTFPFSLIPLLWTITEVRDFQPPPSFPVSFAPSCVWVSVHHLFKVVTFLLGSVDSDEQLFFCLFLIKKQNFLIIEDRDKGVQKQKTLLKRKISPLLAIHYLKKFFFTLQIMLKRQRSLKKKLKKPGSPPPEVTVCDFHLQTVCFGLARDNFLGEFCI